MLPKPLYHINLNVKHELGNRTPIVQHEFGNLTHFGSSDPSDPPIVQHEFRNLVHFGPSDPSPILALLTPLTPLIVQHAFGNLVHLGPSDPLTPHCSARIWEFDPFWPL